MLEATLATCYSHHGCGILASLAEVVRLAAPKLGVDRNLATWIDEANDVAAEEPGDMAESDAANSIARWRVHCDFTES